MMNWLIEENLDEEKETGLLFSLIEMRELEELLVKETKGAAEITELPQAKEVFSGWAHESEKHLKSLQNAIDKISMITPIEECKKCIEAGFKASYGRGRLVELVGLEGGGLGMKELYSLAKKHLIIEGDAEGRYMHIAGMTDDEEIKEMLKKISEDEKRHYHEAQQLVDVIEKNFGDAVKEMK